MRYEREYQDRGNRYLGQRKCKNIPTTNIQETWDTMKRPNLWIQEMCKEKKPRLKALKYHRKSV